MALLSDIVAVYDNSTGEPVVNLAYTGTVGTMSVKKVWIENFPSLLMLALKKDGWWLDSNSPVPNMGATRQSSGDSQAVAARIFEQLDFAASQPPVGIMSITTAGGDTVTPAVGTITGFIPGGTDVTIRLTVDSQPQWVIGYPVPARISAADLVSVLQGIIGWTDVDDSTVVRSDIDADLTFLAINGGSTLTIDTFSYV